MHDHALGTVAATAAPGMTGPSASADLLRGIWKENPVLVQLLGMCPTLAVTNSVANSLTMAAATTCVLLLSCVLVSVLRKVIPNEVRITAFVLIIATFVTVADFTLAALVPEIHKSLGAFIALIVVNCIILGRQEAFAARNPVGRSLLDAIGMSGGFAIVLILMSGIRELLGSGSLLGFNVMGPNFEPWVIMVLPPGGFFTLAFYLLIFGWWKERQLKRAGQAPLRTWRNDITRVTEPEEVTV